MLLPPRELVLDTSFVVDALIPSQARPELWEAAYKIALKELHPKKRAADVRRDRRTQTLREEVDAAWRQVLTALDWAAIDLAEVERWLPRMMAYGLTSFDAVHAATAAYVA